MTQPRKEQLNILRAVWTVTTVSITGNVTSTVLPGSFVSSSVTQIPGGNITSNPPIRGIVTTGVGGFVRLKLASNALTLDYNGLQIFGRLSFSGGNYILSYKVISGGVETTATIPAGTYNVQLMYSEVMNFGEIPVNADVIYGSNQELLPSGSAISGNLTVGGNTILGTNSSNTLSLNAQLNTSLVPTPDNTVSLGSSALRFATTNTTSLAARADNTDTIKSTLTASSLLASSTAFTVDGSNTIAIAPSTATALNLGRTGITTTVNGTLSAAGLATVGSNLTVNGASSVFNGNLNVTGTLTTGSILFANLNVSGNSTLGTSSSNTINFLATMISSLLPQAPDVYDIGASTANWRNIHSTRLFTHYDTTSTLYSFLEPDNLFASTDFDIDGYGALLAGVTHANSITVGRASIPVTIDGYEIVIAGQDITETANHNITLTATNALGLSGTSALLSTIGPCTIDGSTITLGATNNIVGTASNNATITASNILNLTGSNNLNLSSNNIAGTATTNWTVTAGNLATLQGNNILVNATTGCTIDGYIIDGYATTINMTALGVMNLLGSEVVVNGSDTLTLGATNDITLNSSLVNFSYLLPSVTITQPQAWGFGSNNGVAMTIQAQQGQNSGNASQNLGGALNLAGGLPGQTTGASSASRQGPVNITGGGITTVVANNGVTTSHVSLGSAIAPANSLSAQIAFDAVGGGSTLDLLGIFNGGSGGGTELGSVLSYQGAGANVPGSLLFNPSSLFGTQLNGQAAGRNISIDTNISGIELSYGGIQLVVNGTGISFYTNAPVAQASRVGQLTDSTTGTPGATVNDVGVAFSQSTLNNNFASILAKLNAIELAIHNIGLTA